VPWLRNGLAIQFENEFGMASLANVVLQSLMAGDTRIGSDVQISEVTHPGLDAVFMSPIVAGVAAKPGLSRPMAVFASNAIAHWQTPGHLRNGNSLQGSVADCAGGATCWITGFQYLGDSIRSGSFERRERPGMVVVIFGPDHELVAIVSGAAMATARAATLHPQEFRHGLRGIATRCYRQIRSEGEQPGSNQREQKPQKTMPLRLPGFPDHKRL
jgi:hypothetical protein